MSNSTSMLTLSSLPHTWFIDLDGTILKHNGYKIDGFDSFLEGAIEFLESIPVNDYIIFITSRPYSMKDQTESFLLKNNVNFKQIIYNVPVGERILINDDKPSGLKTSIAISRKRDNFERINILIDKNL